jgi:hypothetical protein
MDAVSFHNQEAQMHYRQLRADMSRNQMQFGQMSRTMQASTGLGSLRGLRHSSFEGPNFNEVYDYGYQQSLYADDLSDRAMGGVSDVYSGFIQPVADVGAGLYMDHAFIEPMMRNMRRTRRQAALNSTMGKMYRSQMNFSGVGNAVQGTSRLGSLGPGHMMGRNTNMFGQALNPQSQLDKLVRANVRGRFGGAALARGALSMGAGFAMSSIALGAVEMGGEFIGVDDAFSQFDNINRMRFMSENFMDGTSGDAFTGRANRRQSKKMYDMIRREDSMSFALKDGESFDEIMQDVEVFNQFDLMQGVKNAEDFKTKFTGLKESVKKITEILGKTFEEGTELLSQYKNMGIRPEKAFGLIQGVQAAANIGGISFDRANSAGLKTALALQGSGLTAEAGIQLGARTEGLAQQIADRIMGGRGQAVNQRHFYNAGGMEGVQMALERGTMGLMQSPLYNASLMAAFDAKTGGFNMNQFVQFAGKGDIAGAMNRTGQNFSSAEDMLKWQSRQSEIFSDLMEGRPEMQFAMGVTSVLGSARMMGMDPENMSMSQIAQLAPQVTNGMLDPNTFLMMVESVMAANEGLGRDQTVKNMQGQARTRERFGGGLKSDIGYFFRDNLSPVVRAGAAATDVTGGMVYSMGDSISRWTDKTFRGAFELDVDMRVVDALREQGLFKGIEDRGAIYEDIATARDDASDIMRRTVGEGRLIDVPALDLDGGIQTYGKMRGFTVKGSQRQKLLDFVESRGGDANALDATMGGTNFIPESVLQDMGIVAIEDDNTLFDNTRIAMKSDLNTHLDQQKKFASGMATAIDKYSGQKLTGSTRRDALDFHYAAMGRVKDDLGEVMTDERHRAATLANAYQEELKSRGLTVNSAEAQQFLAASSDKVASTYGQAGAAAQRELTEYFGSLESLGNGDTARERMQDASQFIIAGMGGFLRQDRAWDITSFSWNDSKFRKAASKIRAQEPAQELFGRAVAMFDEEKADQSELFHDLAGELETQIGVSVDLEALIRERMQQMGPEEFKRYQKSIRGDLASVARAAGLDGVEGATGVQTVNGSGVSVNQASANEERDREQTLVLQQTARMLNEMMGTMGELSRQVQSNSQRLNR